ncbi:MAG TPA: nucleoside hydrolase [Gaiellales bacterium]|nr:nucleoside hydrolase [Gaiellales bacterium]
MTAVPIVLDCDPGHDDAIAILLALGSPEVDLLAVTAVAGNAPLVDTTANAIRVLDHAGRPDIPVAAGAARPLLREPVAAGGTHGDTGLDGPALPAPSRQPTPEHAIDLIARLAEEASPTLVATGPLTNVALLLARHPTAAERLQRIVLMGGAIGLGNVTPAAEFNIWADPEAAARVFASGLDVTMVGLDATHQALITREQNERLRSRGRSARLASELVDFYSRAHEHMEGSPIHDAVAVAQVVQPELLELTRCHVEVDCSPLSRGRTLVDLHGVTGRAPNASVATGIDPGFSAFMCDRVAAAAP